MYGSLLIAANMHTIDALVKNQPASAGETRDSGSITGLGKSSRVGNGNQSSTQACPRGGAPAGLVPELSRPQQPPTTPGQSLSLRSSFPKGSTPGGRGGDAAGLSVALRESAGAAGWRQRWGLWLSGHVHNFAPPRGGRRGAGGGGGQALLSQARQGLGGSRERRDA